MAETAPTIQSREIGRRDWRKIALTEILCVSVFSAGFFALVLIVWNEFSSAPTIGVVDLLSRFGTGASDLVMGGLGVVATVQLACFIAIVTGQIIHQDGAEESRLRGMLSVISLAAVTALGPSILAVSFHSLQSFEDNGLLLVVLPIYGLQLGISTVIGTFEVGDDETLLGFAEEHEERTQEQIVRLEKWPTASPWRAVLAVGIMVIAAAVLSAPITAVLLRWIEFPVLGSLISAVIALCCGLAMSVFGLVITNSQLKRSVGTIDIVSVGVIHLMVALFFVFCLLLVVFSFWPLAVPMGLLAFLLVLLAITSFPEGHRVRQGLRPRRKSLPVVGIFGLVGTREALAAARKEQASAQKQVGKYAARITERAAKHASANPAPDTADPTAADQAVATSRDSRLARALAELLS